MVAIKSFRELHSYTSYVMKFSKIFVPAEHYKELSVQLCVMEVVIDKYICVTHQEEWLGERLITPHHKENSLL
jgi:hypothetical protein